MGDNYNMQGLSQEKTPFPYSWEKIQSFAPCRYRTGQDNHPNEEPLSTWESNKLRQRFGVGGEPPGSEPVDKMDFHIHDHCQITQCTSGCIVYIFGKSHVVLRPGDILVVNAMIPHSWLVLEQNTVRYQLGFYPHSLSANTYSQCLLPYFRLVYDQHHPYIQLEPNTAGYDEVVHLLGQIKVVHNRRTFAFDTLIHNLIFEISSHLLFLVKKMEESSVKKEKSLQKALLYIEEHIEEELSIQMVAEAVNMNASYFSSYFKKHLGIPFKRYAITRKVAKAAGLLRHTELSITEILFACGFSSLSAFYNAFNSVYAVSPTRFRKLSCGFADRDPRY